MGIILTLTGRRVVNFLRRRNPYSTYHEFYNPRFTDDEANVSDGETTTRESLKAALPETGTVCCGCHCL